MLPSTESQATEGQKRDRIRQIIKNHAGLGLDFEKIAYSTDLYRAGMTSYASVALMIALESEFEGRKHARKRDARNAEVFTQRVNH